MKKHKYYPWQHLSRAISLFLYMFTIILIFNQKLITQKIMHPILVISVLLCASTFMFVISYFYEYTEVKDDSLIRSISFGSVYNKRTKVLFKDIIGIYGLKNKTKCIYIIANNISHWLPIAKAEVSDLTKLKEKLLNKDVSKKEFLELLKMTGKYKKGDEEFIRKLY